MKIELKALDIHEIGNRPNQEDNMWPRNIPRKDERLFIVCDGMGGHEKGEVASDIISRAMGWYINEYADKRGDGILTDEMLKEALTYAYDELDREDGGELKKMGTTLTFFYAGRNGVMVAHIGDSRIYHIRPGVGMLYKSRDHSLVFDKYWRGEITEEQMATDPQKNVIYKAITTGIDNRVEPSICHIIDVQEGDWFYLCSDGMLERMTDDQLVAILTSNDSDDEKRETLIRETDGNNDNHTAWMLRVVRVEDESDVSLLEDNLREAKCNALNRPHHEESTVIETMSMPQSYQPAMPPRNITQAQEGDVVVVGNAPKAVAPPLSAKKKRKNNLRIFLLSLLTALLLVVIAFGGYQLLNKGEKVILNKGEEVGDTTVPPTSPTPPIDFAELKKEIKPEIDRYIHDSVGTDKNGSDTIRQEVDEALNTLIKNLEKNNVKMSKEEAKKEFFKCINKTIEQERENRKRE